MRMVLVMARRLCQNEFLAVKTISRRRIVFAETIWFSRRQLGFRGDDFFNSTPTIRSRDDVFFASNEPLLEAMILSLLTSRYAV